MEPLAIRLLVNVYAEDTVISGEVIRTSGDRGDDAVSQFSGHLGLITAIERAIDAAINPAVEQRPPPEAPSQPIGPGSLTLGPTTA